MRSEPKAASWKCLNHYLTGFVDGEGCFCVSVKRLRTSRFGYTLDPVFHVTQNESGRVVLDLLREAMGCGRIIEKHGQPGTLQFHVHKRRELLDHVVPFLETSGLRVKRPEFETFRTIVVALEAREHWTLAGFERLLRLAFTMNGSGKQRRYQLGPLLHDIRKRAGSSETIRRTPRNR